MPSEPMNLIVITSDEMRGDVPGFMGNPDCRTPNLDRFAGRAVAFRNHFTVHGKCVPSRIAMITGRYSHTDGFRTIQQHLPPEQPSLGNALKDRGYEMAYFGHNHIWEDFWGENIKGKGYPDYHSYTEGYFQEMLDRKWPAPPAPQEGPQPFPEAPKELQTYRETDGYSGFVDHNRAEQAIHYLTSVRDRDRPFYLHCNFGTPHPAYRVEEPYYSMYDRDAIQAWPHELPDDAPLPLQKMREIRSGQEPREEWLREVQAVYYGMCTRVDSHIGKMLDCIEREGLFENSIVMFWVDHGDFAGQYGLPEKWDTYMGDCILHVPQIVWAPGLPQGHTVESLTEHVDICPTVLDLMGIEPDWGIHGESLLPIIEGKRRKEAVFADGGHEEEMWDRMDHPRWKDVPVEDMNGKQATYKLSGESMARTKMVRTERWKYVQRTVGGNELYDLQADPEELDNLYPDHRDDPELTLVVLDLQERMIDWCLKTDTDRPYQEDVGA
jgi:choline-sulfatase